jgi:hypothetical protein
MTLFLGPRVAILFWWLVEPSRWSSAFSTFLWPLIGFFVVPWTTLMFVAVAPFGNVSGWDWMWLGLAFLIDFSSLTSGGYYNRGRMPRYT